MSNTNEESIEMLLSIKKSLLSDLMSLFVMLMSGLRLFIRVTHFLKMNSVLFV